MELLLYHPVPHSRCIFSGTRKPDTEIWDLIKVDNSDIKTDVLDAHVVRFKVLYFRFVRGARGTATY